MRCGCNESPGKYLNARKDSASDDARCELGDSGARRSDV